MLSILIKNLAQIIVQVFEYLPSHDKTTSLLIELIENVPSISKYVLEKILVDFNFVKNLIHKELHK